MGYFDEDPRFGDVGILKELVEEQKEKDFDKKRKELDEALELARGRSKSDQTAKADNGKLRLTLVPRQIIFEIAKIREYGNAKYGDPENWRRVEIERYRDAAFRHFMAYLDDPYGVDEESGLPHLSHLACNVAFLCEMQKNDYPVRCADEAKPMPKDMGDPGFVNGLVANQSPPSLTAMTKEEKEAIDKALEKYRTPEFLAESHYVRRDCNG